MIVNKELLAKLKDFGLNSYESKLWTAILSRGISTAGELSDIANVPRSRSYDVLESLERKGFIITKLGKPIKYIAVPPSEVIERVKKRVKEDADYKSKTLESLRGSEVLDELNNLHKKGVDVVGPGEITGTIKSRTNLHNQLETMIRNASSSVVFVTTEAGFIRKIEALQPLLEQAKARGVNIRFVVPLTKKSKPIADSIQNIAEVRKTKDTMGRFCVIDGKECLFMLVDDVETHPSYDVGVWATAPFFAKSMHQLIEKVWDQLPPA
jgi:sugar-specific transcriptional regulator TrmB